MLKESGSEVNKIECCFILHPKWYDVLCFFVLGWVGMECKKIGSIFKTRKRHHPLALANFRSGFSIGESHTVGWNPAPPGMQKNPEPLWCIPSTMRCRAIIACRHETWFSKSLFVSIHWHWWSLCVCIYLYIHILVVWYIFWSIW